MQFLTARSSLPSGWIPKSVFAGPVARAGSIVYSDENDANHIGWREIAVVGEDGEARSAVPTCPPRASKAIPSGVSRRISLSSLARHVDACVVRARPLHRVGQTESNLRKRTDDAARPGVDSSPFSSLVDNQRTSARPAPGSRSLAFRGLARTLLQATARP